MKELINASMLNSFMDKIHSVCPNFVAGVITDKHGLPMASKIHPKLSLSEQLLSLEAVSGDRKIVDISGMEKIIQPLSENVRLLMLLKGSSDNSQALRDFNRVVKDENPI